MTTEIITFDENSIKTVICIENVNTTACGSAPASHISFEQEMKENPGIDFKTPPPLHGGFDCNIESYFSVYIDNKFNDNYMGVKAYGRYFLCPTI